MSVDRIKREIVDRWPGQPIASTCLRLVDFLTRVPASQLEMLTYKTFANALEKRSIDQEVVSAVALLTAPPVDLLDVHMLFIDDDDSEYEIASKDFAEIRLSGRMYHPDTGAPVEDFEKKLFPFFVPSERFNAEVHGE